MHITPKVHAALSAIATAPDSRLVRCRGGYCPSNAASPVITTRTVNTMDRAWLIELTGPFHSAAELTPKGRAAIEDIAAEEATKAGAA